MNRIDGHAAAAGRNNSGSISNAATTKPRTRPTTPPAISAAGVRRSSFSIPETARSVSRPRIPPAT
jgi:hypothetical protein